MGQVDALVWLIVIIFKLFQWRLGGFPTNAKNIGFVIKLQWWSLSASLVQNYDVPLPYWLSATVIHIAAIFRVHKFPKVTIHQQNAPKHTIVIAPGFELHQITLNMIKTLSHGINIILLFAGLPTKVCRGHMATFSLNRKNC